jgi:hypothetical protein
VPVSRDPAAWKLRVQNRTGGDLQNLLSGTSMHMCMDAAESAPLDLLHGTTVLVLSLRHWTQDTQSSARP